MNTLRLQHLSEELLERYLMRQVSESEAEAVETHLLMCDSCPERLDELEDYRDVMRMGFALLAAEERQIQAALARARELWVKNVESGTPEPGGSVRENRENRDGENSDGEILPQSREPRAILGSGL
jgi:anti-sigma factor RsiW